MNVETRNVVYRELKPLTQLLLFTFVPNNEISSITSVITNVLSSNQIKQNTCYMSRV